MLGCQLHRFARAPQALRPPAPSGRRDAQGETAARPAVPPGRSVGAPRRP